MTQAERHTVTGLYPAYPIETERLLLRPHRLDDLDDLVGFHGDPDVVRYIPWPVRDREATAAALEAKLDRGALTAPGQWLVLAVEVRASATVIGEVLLKWASAEDRQGEVGYAFGRAHQGKGYAAEAVRALLRLGFDDLDLHRIVAVVVDENEPSARLLRRLGFVEEGRFVDATMFKGAWTTERVFALTEGAWREPGIGGDQTEIQALIDCFFNAFTSGCADDVDARIAALRAVCLPSAVIVRTCGDEPAAADVATFTAPRRAMLTDGTLTGFREAALDGRIDLVGDIAQWFGRYAKQGILNGEPYAGTGVTSIQFVRTADGWRISAVVWDDDRD
ncbi:MAG: hypothetical protein NVS3B1_20290 [Marmoricola sp.]